jgi:hypothetical protein
MALFGRARSSWRCPIFGQSMPRDYERGLPIVTQTNQWAAFVLLVSALFAVLPIASKIVDYGAEGWLWARLKR